MYTRRPLHRVVLAAVLAIALLTTLGAPAAAAQDGTTQLEYPGPLRLDNEDLPLENSDIGNAFTAVDARPGDGGADTTTVGGTGGGSTLAATGSRVEPILAISIGLLAVGGSVLVTSRRREYDAAG